MSQLNSSSPAQPSTSTAANASDSDQLREKLERDRQRFEMLSKLTPAMVAPTTKEKRDGSRVACARRDPEKNRASSSSVLDSTTAPTEESKPNKVKDWDWMEYPVGQPQVNYMRDFLRANRGNQIAKKKLGIASESFESVQLRNERKRISTLNSYASGLVAGATKAGGSGNLQTAGASGAKKYVDITSSIEERILKFGRVNVSVVHSNLMEFEKVNSTEGDYPELKRLMVKDNNWGDFFVVKGGIKELTNSGPYLKRERLKNLLDKMEEKTETQEFYNERTSEETARKLQSGFFCATGSKKKGVSKASEEGEEC